MTNLVGRTLLCCENFIIWWKYSDIRLMFQKALDLISSSLMGTFWYMIYLLSVWIHNVSTIGPGGHILLWWETLSADGDILSSDISLMWIFDVSNLGGRILLPCENHPLRLKPSAAKCTSGTFGWIIQRINLNLSFFREWLFYAFVSTPTVQVRIGWRRICNISPVWDWE